MPNSPPLLSQIRPAKIFSKKALHIPKTCGTIAKQSRRTDSPSHIWGRSSAGRALEWHSRGHRFDPDRLHQKEAENQRFPASCFFALLVKCLKYTKPAGGMGKVRSPVRKQRKNSRDAHGGVLCGKSVFPNEVCGSRAVARINAASYTRGAKREVSARTPYKCQIRKNTRGKARAVPQSTFILLSILKTPQNKRRPCFAHSRQSLRQCARQAQVPTTITTTPIQS